MTNKAISIFNQLRPLSVGFDDVFDHFESMFDSPSLSLASNYPPYNIVKTGKHTYDVEVALAGYGKKDIDVTYEDGMLTIKSIKDKETKEGEEVSRNVVVEFPSYEIALEAYESQEYQEALKVLDGGALRLYAVVEGY